MLSRQVSALSRRLFCSVPSNLGNEFKNAKPFSEVPKVSAWRMIKSVLPGGRYYKKPMSEVIRLMYEDYGVIFKIPPMFGKPSFVITYSAENFEKVKWNCFFLWNDQSINVWSALLDGSLKGACSLYARVKFELRYQVRTLELNPGGKARAIFFYYYV